MLRRIKNNGFSLTEVLLAAGILAVGFMLVATTFPVGIKLTTVATERTISAAAADEALAKMEIYGVDPNKLVYNSLEPFDSSVLVTSRYTDLATYFLGLGMPVPDSIDAFLDAESLYPSTEAADMSVEQPKYHWSALLLRTGVDTVDAVVFVSRKAGAGVMYPNPLDPLNPLPLDAGNPTGTIEWPEPIEIRRVDTGLIKVIEINAADEELAKFIADDAVIVDNETGERMRILRREKIGADTYPRRLILAEAVNEAQLGQSFWVIPVGLGSGRNPCVSVEVWDL
jgi:prepilin-type N-terminal cleavage/methylation domain-containing protein